MGCLSNKEEKKTSDYKWIVGKSSIITGDSHVYDRNICCEDNLPKFYQISENESANEEHKFVVIMGQQYKNKKIYSI